MITLPDKLDEPLQWRRPYRVFVNSMSDLFHEQVPVDFIAAVWATMILAPRHTFQILTKRPERMRAVLSDPDFYDRVLWAAETQIRPRRPELLSVPISNPSRSPARHIWLGTSCEDQRRADERIPHLLQTPAAIHWLSCEPLLGPLDLDRWLWDVRHHYDAETGEEYSDPEPSGALDWIVCGGESGPGHRPMDLAWARSVQEQCEMAEVPLWFKQDSGPRSGMRPDVLGQIYQSFPEVPV